MNVARVYSHHHHCHHHYHHSRRRLYHHHHIFNISSHFCSWLHGRKADKELCWADPVPGLNGRLTDWQNEWNIMDDTSPSHQSNTLRHYDYHYYISLRLITPIKKKQSWVPNSALITDCDAQKCLEDFSGQLKLSKHVQLGQRRSMRVSSLAREHGRVRETGRMRSCLKAVFPKRYLSSNCPWHRQMSPFTSKKKERNKKKDQIKERPEITTGIFSLSFFFSPTRLDVNFFFLLSNLYYFVSLLRFLPALSSSSPVEPFPSWRLYGLLCPINNFFVSVIQEDLACFEWSPFSHCKGQTSKTIHVLVLNCHNISRSWWLRWTTASGDCTGFPSFP